MIGDFHDYHGDDNGDDHDYHDDDHVYGPTAPCTTAAGPSAEVHAGGARVAGVLLDRLEQRGQLRRRLDLGEREG